MPATHIEEIAKHTATVTDKIFSPRVETQAPDDKVESIIIMAKSIEKMIDDIAKHYSDNRGNISESLRMAGDIIENMQGHRRDVEAGLE